MERKQEYHTVCMCRASSLMANLTIHHPFLSDQKSLVLLPYIYLVLPNFLANRVALLLVDKGGGCYCNTNKNASSRQMLNNNIIKRQTVVLTDYSYILGSSNCIFI